MAEFKQTTARFHDSSLQDSYQYKQQSVYQNTNIGSEASIQDSNYIEELQFELRVEQLKNEKFLAQWRQKKYQYEDEISQLKEQNHEKEVLLDRLELDLKQMRDKVQMFYDAYQDQEKHCQELALNLKDCQSSKFKIEVDYATQRDNNSKLAKQNLAAQIQIQNMKDQMLELAQVNKHELSIKNKQLNTLKHLYDQPKEFLKQLTGTKNNMDKSFIELIQIAIGQVMDMCEKKIKSDFDLLEQRVKITQQSMRKLKLQYIKVNSEKLFYKDIYKQRNENKEAVWDDRMLLTTQKTTIGDNDNNFQTIQQIIKQKDMNQILSHIEKPNSSAYMTQLPFSPVSKFSPAKIDSPDETELIDTFRSQGLFQREVDDALEKAQLLMKFKHDKVFINQVLDAQIRVNVVEQNIMKSVGLNSTNQTPHIKGGKKQQRSFHGDEQSITTTGYKHQYGALIKAFEQ